MEITKEQIFKVFDNDILPAWQMQSCKYPDYLEKESNVFPRIDEAQKKENEILFDDFKQKIQKAFSKKPKKKDAEAIWQEEMEQIFQDFVDKEQVLQIKKYLGNETLQQSNSETKHFLQQVKDFDPKLSTEQIWQAMRNYFIYSMLLELQGVQQNANEPVVAYSLLYPYTDNFIDDAKKSKAVKKRFNQLIEDKLKEKEVVPHSLLENKICRLLECILNIYSETDARHEKEIPSVGLKFVGKEEVRQSLLLLLEAQSNSMQQHSQSMEEQEEKQLIDDLLHISLYKGSTSVLADYFFASDTWNEEEAIFYLKFGFLLQLVDDLQDLKEDDEKGSHTLMTTAFHSNTLESRVNQLLWFTKTSIDQFEPRDTRIKTFVLRHCIGITLITAAMCQDGFSEEYLSGIQDYLPFSLDYLSKLKADSVLPNKK